MGARAPYVYVTVSHYMLTTTLIVYTYTTVILHVAPPVPALCA